MFSSAGGIRTDKQAVGTGPCRGRREVLDRSVSWLLGRLHVRRYLWFGGSSGCVCRYVDTGGPTEGRQGKGGGDWSNLRHGEEGRQ